MVRKDPSRRRVVLVGCVKGKRAGTHPAKDLYTSALFRRRRSYAESSGEAWFVLSAKHGLVEPNAELESYDATLDRMARVDRRSWGEAVVAALDLRLGGLAGTTVEVHAGARYVDAIRRPLEAHGARLVVPTAGLGLGRQLQWYSTSREWNET